MLFELFRGIIHSGYSKRYWALYSAFVCEEPINTNALILTQYLIVDFGKGHELLLLQRKNLLKIGGRAVTYKYCLKDI